MSENSKIEWTDHTFNPWTGCTKVSPACDNCYAEGWSKRSGHVHWGPHGDRRRTKTWGDPVKWNRQAEGLGYRPRVFCASLSDVFDNQRSIDPAWRRDLWHLIHQTPRLDWLLLTKRPQNIAKMLPEAYGAPAWGDGWHNVWLGTTVENQEEADRRIPHLLNIPARVRFLSCEPLLGPVCLKDMDVERHPAAHGLGRLGGYWINALTGENDDMCRPCPDVPRIHWVITGGESGPGARPTHPQWFRELRDQCAAAGTPFLFKQWGEWVSVSEVEGPGRHHQFEDGATVRRVGKKLAGRTLDGVIHNAFPTPSDSDAVGRSDGQGRVNRESI